MQHLLERYLNPLREGEGAGAGQGGGQGGDGGQGQGGHQGGAGQGGQGGDGGQGGGGGGAGEAWYLAKDVGLDDQTQRFLAGKNPPDLKTALSSWRSADEMARTRNVFDKPDPKAIKDWKGWQELGWVPEREKYALSEVKHKQGERYDSGFEKALVDAAHDARVPLPAATAIRDALVAYTDKAFADLEAKGAAENTALDAALKTKWGSEAAKNEEIARRAARASGLSAEALSRMEKAISDSAELMAFFYKIGADMSEDQLTGATGGGGGGPSTPEAARAERLRLEGDKDWMRVFNNARDPQNAAYVAQRDRLLAIEAKSRKAA